MQSRASSFQLAFVAFYLLALLAAHTPPTAARLLLDDLNWTKAIAARDPTKTNAIAHNNNGQTSARTSAKSGGIFMNRGKTVNAGGLYPAPRATTVNGRSSRGQGPAGSINVIALGRNAIAADIDGQTNAKATSNAMGVLARSGKVSAATASAVFR